MGTTNAELAGIAIDVLNDAGVRFAFLHREDEVARGQVSSDMDLLVERPPSQVLGMTGSRWRASGLVPIMASTYDVGCTALWLATPDGADGVQIDLTYDSTGRNHFGATTTWLDGARVGTRWPVVADEHTATYVENKRRAKAEGRGTRVRDLPRLAGRVRNPPGCWLHDVATTTTSATQVQERFDRYLPGTLLLTGSDASPLRAVVLARRAALRACLVVSSSPGVITGADVVTASDSADDLARRAVEAMARRVTDRLRDSGDSVR